ncbi:MAG: calcium/sodium antiporter [Phycisphaerales bacterium]|nr:calcium/sodium antiporter [Planctomycetota bacterium]MCH8509491.1 calcium/sodium antiporter [Phycisphaerales bacterium]
MSVALSALILCVGLGMLVLGADALVRASASLARRAGVSEFVVGVTVVAFGTSAPELFASVGAVLQNQSDLALGNIVGSNIANILLILGAGGLIAPIAMTRTVRNAEIPVMAGITAVAMVFMLDGRVGRFEGLLLVLGLAGYILFAIRAGAVDPQEAAPDQPGGVLKDAGVILLGVVALGLGTRAIVLSAQSLAEGVGVAPGVIGTTIVAFGTSLPELATTVRAAIARKSDIAVGNIVGSNVFNLLSVLGACAIVAPLGIPGPMWPHVYAMGAVTVAILIYALVRPVIGRWVGLVFLAAYLAYVILAF